MSVWTVVCLIFGGLFLLLGVVFALLGEKGAMLISGFNTLTKRQREQYDTEKMSRDVRNQMLLWGVLAFGGAVLSYFLHYAFAVVALGVIAVLFFREVHFDTEKAFGKYRK